MAIRGVDETLEKIMSKLKQCEELIHETTQTKLHSPIPFIAVIMRDNVDKAYITVLQQKEFTRPSFWLLGGMCYRSKGRIGTVNGYPFTDAVFQYQNCQDQGINNYDEPFPNQEYVNTIKQLDQICNEISELCEDIEYPWFITYDVLNAGATHDNNMFERRYYSTDILFDSLPAYTVAMYLAKYVQLEAAAAAFERENVNIEGSKVAQLFNEYV